MSYTRIIIMLKEKKRKIFIINSLISLKFNPCKLQCIQNSAARIVSNTSRYTSISPVLKKLHWILVEHCTVFKTTRFVYKFLYTGFPKYFAAYISSYHSSYSARCSQSGIIFQSSALLVNKSIKQFGYSFAFDAPTVLNAFHDNICVSPSLASFQE